MSCRRASLWCYFVGISLSVLSCSNSTDGTTKVIDETSDTIQDTLSPVSIIPETVNGVCGNAPGQLLSKNHAWNQKVDTVALDIESEQIIAFLQSHRDHEGTFQIDGPSEEENSTYGLTILNASSKDRTVFSRTDDFFTPDCDLDSIPLPAGGAVEGEQDYTCSGDGDCHLIVIDEENCQLHEMWRANLNSSLLVGGCQAVWDLTEEYDETLRGECCTSADAAGLPIAALTFTADDIAAGSINHALRFILPNSFIRERAYVRPATHATGATSGPESAPPYGARLRLKQDADLAEFNEASKVVLKALKEYGMILSDGGNITFTAANDRFTEHKWKDVGLGPRDLLSLNWTDFEVIELGDRFYWGSDCYCDR